MDSLTFDDDPLARRHPPTGRPAGLNIQFDHKLETRGYRLPRLPFRFPTVKEKWKNLTAMQALQALLDKYDWQMKRSANTPVVIIGAKEPNAVEPQVMKVILLGYSEPTNIVFEVQKALGATASPLFRTCAPTRSSSAPRSGKCPLWKTHRPARQRHRPVLIEAKIIETTQGHQYGQGD